MWQRKRGRSGQALIEFTLVGIPMMFMTISIVGGSIDMWEFQSLAYATEMTARYASVHGATCSLSGNTCSITLGNAAQFFATQAMALPSGSVNVTFTDGSGATNCNPLNTCNSSSARYPNASYNGVGSDVTVSATFHLTNPLAMFWPPDINGARTYTLGAKSRQRIQF